MGWYGGGGGGSLPSTPAWTLEGNPSGSTAPITSFTIGGLTGKTTPAGTDQILLQDNAASGQLKFVNWANLPSGGGGGMSIGGAVTSGSPFDVLYVGTGPVLAQDSGFQYTATGQILLGGSQLNLLVNSVSVPVIRSVYNSGGDLNNWFFAQSGNTTATGWGSLGIGQSNLSLLSSGSDNIALGNYAARVLTTGNNNIAVGPESLFNLDSGNSNIAVGWAALSACVSGSNNIAVGKSALSSCTVDGNVAIGGSALGNVTTGSFNFGLGFNAGPSLVTGSGDIFIGFNAGASIIDSFNVAIGYQSFGAGTGSNNVVIGDNNFNTTSGSGYNVVIGTNTARNLTGAACVNNTWIGPYLSPSGTTNYNNTAIFGAGADHVFTLDFNVMTSNVWSFEGSTGPTPATGVHIYNTTDGLFSKTNWERAVLDWVTTSNVFTIGTQAGGTGTLRNIKFVQGATNILDYGVTTASIWTFAFKIAVPGAANPVLTTTAAITTGAGASAGTLTNAPAAGNPTKWIPISDAGTTRYIPAW